MKLLTLPIIVLIGAIGMPVPAAQPSEGHALAVKNGCTGCHAMDRQTVGPAIRDIARLYAAQADASVTLATKVKQGCGGPWKGVWGQVPMPPNPDLQEDQIRLAVDWMLQQK